MSLLQTNTKAEKPVIIYADMASQPCRAVLAFCALNGISVQVRILRIRGGEHRILANNPTGKLPCLEEDGFFLAESHAIMTYLWTTRRLPDHWYPVDPRKRAICDQYLHWHHSGLRSIGRYLFFAYAAKKIGYPSSESMVKEQLQESKTALVLLEKWLEGQNYILGSEISIADLSAVCEIAQMQLIPELLNQTLADHPNIRRWFTSIYTIPQVKSQHTLIEKIGARNSPKPRL